MESIFLIDNHNSRAWFLHSLRWGPRWRGQDPQGRTCNLDIQTHCTHCLGFELETHSRTWARDFSLTNIGKWLPQIQLNIEKRNDFSFKLKFHENVGSIEFIFCWKCFFSLVGNTWSLILRDTNTNVGSTGDTCRRLSRLVRARCLLVRVVDSS